MQKSTEKDKSIHNKQKNIQKTPNFFNGQTSDSEQLSIEAAKCSKGGLTCRDRENSIGL